MALILIKNQNESKKYVKKNVVMHHLIHVLSSNYLYSTVMHFARSQENNNEYSIEKEKEL